MITYWGNPQPNGSGGFVFDSPVQIEARWHDRVEETMDDRGATFVSRAKVFVRVDLDLGGYLFNGNSLIADPTTVEGAYKIRNFFKRSNIGRTKIERKAIL